MRGDGPAELLPAATWRAGAGRRRVPTSFLCQPSFLCRPRRRACVARAWPRPRGRESQAGGRAISGDARLKVDAIWTADPLRLKGTGEASSRFATRSSGVFGALYLSGTLNLSKVVLIADSACLDMFQLKIGGMRMKMRIIPAIARLGVLTWLDQASAQDTSPSTVSPNPDVVLSADNVGRVWAGASKLLREVSARISNPHNVAYNVTFKRSALVTTFASLASAARSRTSRRRGKLSPVSFLAPAGKMRFA